MMPLGSTGLGIEFFLTRIYVSYVGECVFFFVNRGLSTGWFFTQGVLPFIYK